MSWISVIDEEEATGQLKSIYNEIAKRRGKVGNILKVHSLNPKTMKSHFDLYISLMFKHSTLSRENREIVATAVSILNGCEYCKLHHGEALNHFWKDDQKLNEFFSDPLSIELTEKSRAILLYATKLTKEPDKFTKDDYDEIKKSGLSDEEILDLNLVISYFNFVNRIANGLGVKFTEEEMKGYNY